MIVMNLKLRGSNMDDILEQVEEHFGKRFERTEDYNAVIDRVEDVHNGLRRLERTVDTLGDRVNVAATRLNDSAANQAPARAIVMPPANSLLIRFPMQGKIDRIKHLRELYPGIGLKEAKDYVEALPSHHPDFIRDNSTKVNGCGGSHNRY